MHVNAEAFWFPKAGNSKDEYEDAYWPQKPIDLTAEAFAFAIADGATEASFSKSWAKALVRAYCKGQLSDRVLGKSLTRLQKKWLEDLTPKDLPWFAEQKLREGAFASILGLGIRSSTTRTSGRIQWDSLAVGDSCLFHVRSESLIQAFPLTESNQFNSTPQLLSSNPTYNNRIGEIISHQSGYADEGDAFYLMTDALSCWFLRTLESGEQPWEVLRDLATSDEDAPFADWITALRVKGLIRNDDVTFLRIEIT